jgi:glycosyltransferase involved in cell wall biosynthesis
LTTEAAPLVSVIIPLFNHELYLEQCLESVLADPYPEKEILILDDGSKDSSLERARNWYEANRHRFPGRFELSSQENRGITRTLNTLIAQAKGEYVAVLASDDYLVAGGLQARVDYLRGHASKMAVFGDCLVVDENNTVVKQSGVEGHHRGRKSCLRQESLVSYEIVFHWCVPGPVFMARRELYGELGGYNEQIAVEDRDFYLRLASRGLVGFLDEAVAAYRVHSQSYSRTPANSRGYNQSLFETVAANLPLFSGLRLAHLVGEKFVLKGLIARQDGRLGLGDFLALKLGRMLLVASKLAYHAAIPWLARR